MSSSPSSPESLEHEETNESDVVCEGSLSLNQEIPNQPPKSDPETIPNQQPTTTDPEESIPEEEEEVEEEDDEEEEEEEEEEDEGTEQETLSVSSGMSVNVDPQITEPHVSAPDVTLSSPTGDTNARRGANSKKKLVRGRSFKGKGKGKGKGYIKQQQAIEEKVRNLMKNLNPIPFEFRKLKDLNEREELLKKLGLWDFAHTDFGSEIRVDLIAELVATYKAKARCSYVNGCRIRVNRADLGRAFELPGKKEKEMCSDWETSSNDDKVGQFFEWFASEFMLLHEDTWMTPGEVIEWLKVIKDGHPEKVDWAGLLWFMVERELKQGVQLKDCYYASHLQHLIKSQREDVFVKEENNEAIPVEESDKEAEEQEKQEEVEVVNEGNVGVVGGPNTELTLGQDGEKEDETKDVEMKDVVEKCEDIDEEGEKEEEEVAEEEEEEEEEDLQTEWLLHGKNDMGEHFLQRCENGGEFVSSFEDKKEVEEIEDEDMDGEEEDEDKFNVFPNDDSLEGDGFTGNLLQAMETNQIAFGSQDHHQLNDCSPSFFNNEGKRVIEHDNHISHHSLTESNKRLRIDDSWEQQHKPLDFAMCMENIHQMTERARLLHEEKERALEQSNMNQQILLSELQKRDSVIEHLHKTKLDEMQKKDHEIYRLERELYLMGGVLDGYRKALKQTQKVFAEYREKAQLLEDPTYKDAGPGGLMLTAAEIERREKKREEDFKMNCLILEQKMKEAEEDYSSQFHVYVDKINLLDKRLTGLEADAKEIVKLYAGRKITQINEEEEVPEEALPIEENVPEVAEEALPIKEKEEKAGEDQESVEIAENQESEANPETGEVAEPVPDE